MVRFKINPSKTIIKRAVFTGILLLVFVITSILLLPKLSEQSEEDNPQTIQDIQDQEYAEKVEEISNIKQVSFQSVVDDWVSTVGGNKSIVIFDLDRDEQVGSYNVEEDYNTASLYKLFVVYEGYIRLQNSEWNADAPAGSTGHTILECLDLSIRESNSPCAETLWGMIGHAELDNIVADKFKITNSSISTLTSNARDITSMMKIFYHHDEITDEELIETMKDSFLNQPVTTYDWRQGLPSGFSVADVYNKVGWDYNSAGGYWNVYHDASIVEFPEQERHFIVVVMTNQVANQAIADFGTRLEQYFLDNQ